MIHDDPIPVPTAKPANGYRRVAAVQGTYFVLAGLWPLLGINSFQAVTGAKTDLWLVYAVGWLVAAIGASLLMAAIRGRTTPEVIALAIASAVGLAGIDVVFVMWGVVSWVYLLDAFAQGGLIAWWVIRYLGPPNVAPAPPYSHLQRLLNRGRSVSLSANGPTRPIV